MKGYPRRFQNPRDMVCFHTTPLQRKAGVGRQNPILLLTCVWLVAIVTLTEVLRVLNDWDAGHTNDHCVRPSIQR